MPTLLIFTKNAFINQETTPVLIIWELIHSLMLKQ